jgi:secreted trypsin-like serine protease
VKFYLLCTALFLSVLIPTQATAIENGLDATGNQHVVKVIATYSKGKVNSCSGGLLSDYVVVTAAHCLDDESGLISKEMWVLPPGSVARRDANGAYLQDANWIQVDNTQITTTYQNVSTKVENDDLAFLVLSRPIELKVNTLIPSEDETTKLKASNAALRLYGYGYISDAGKISDAPNYYIGRFDSQTPFSVKNSGYATSTDATSCQGDSGGPVLSVTATTVTVVGVITGGATSIRCGKKNTDGKYYTLFTYLSRYANLAFAAASSASKKAIEAANSAKEDAEDALSQAEADYEEARQEAEDSATELESLQSELDEANQKVDELEIIIQNLQNEIMVLTAKLTVTINCIKGKTTKKVTGINPKCPKGYKKK